MNDDTAKFLGLRRLPGRITAEQVAQLLQFAVNDIPVLVKAKLLKPLGAPPQQAVKYFASDSIEKLARDEKWLTQATRAIYNFWHIQNQKKKASRQAPQPMAA